jgi:hypothetical protein
MSIEPPRLGQRFRHWLRGDDVQYGCSYCADDANRAFGHVEQVASNDAFGILIRCPRCSSLYQDAGFGLAKRLTVPEAEVAFAESLGSRDIQRR